MKNKSPIGFFDSGYGGLTVLKEVQRVLPLYDYLYLGDNKRTPYGTKDAETVFEYTWECVQRLFAEGCELVVLACNTASAKTLRRIQQTKLQDFPGKRVLGVIRPSAEVVADYSTTNQIVVLGTQGTINSNTYIEEFEFFYPQTKVHQYACPTWVPLIESNQYNTEEGKIKIKQDIDAVREMFPDADVLLLGCTHYPILQDYIISNLPETIHVVSQGEIVADSLKLYLERHKWMKEKITANRKSIYLTTGDSKDFEKQASQILGIHVSAIQIKI